MCTRCWLKRSIGFHGLLPNPRTSHLAEIVFYGVVISDKSCLSSQSIETNDCIYDTAIFSSFSSCTLPWISVKYAIEADRTRCACWRARFAISWKSTDSKNLGIELPSSLKFIPAPIGLVESTSLIFEKNYIDVKWLTSRAILCRMNSRQVS